jgi:hypothetical protein
LSAAIVRKSVIGFDEHTSIADPTLCIFCGNLENHSSKNPEETSKPQGDVEAQNHILNFIWER